MKVPTGLEFLPHGKKSCSSLRSLLIYDILTYVFVSRVDPKWTFERSSSLWHLMPCPFTTREVKGTILSITSSQWLSQMRICGNGGQRTGNWLSFLCHKKLMACKASLLTFRTVFAHNVMQVQMDCLSTGCTPSLFQSKYSACPERAADDPG
jgi:hypothetical protein